MTDTERIAALETTNRLLTKELQKAREQFGHSKARAEVFRAVLVGAEFERIDDIPSKGLDVARRIGELAALATKEIIANRDALLAQVQTLTRENAEQAKDLSLDRVMITNLRTDNERLYARERELVKELEATQSYERRVAAEHELLQDVRQEIASLQSEKSLLTKAVKKMADKFDGKVTECRNAWEAYRAAESRAADLQRAIEEKDKALRMALNAFEKNWAIDWNEIEAALSPRQPQDGAKCSCGEPSPDRLVVHRKDGPCYLRPQPPEEGR